MTELSAKDIMHPRISLSTNERGIELINKLTSGYPALPVVNDDMQVVGIVSDFDILHALKEGLNLNEFSAESIMTCGHVEHTDVCDTPITVSPSTPVEKIIDIMFKDHFSILPVVNDDCKLVGIIARKNIINMLSEKGFWSRAKAKAAA